MQLADKVRLCTHAKYMAPRFRGQRQHFEKMAALTIIENQLDETHASRPAQAFVPSELLPMTVWFEQGQAKDDNVVYKLCLPRDGNI